MEMPTQEPLLASDPNGQRDRASSQGSTYSRVCGVHEYETRFPPIIFVPSWTLISLISGFGALLALCLTVWQEWLAEHGLPSEKLLEYVSIPVVSTIFTYCHIWAALYMTFYPLRYIGCLQIPDTNVGCGWQGIVPNRADFMARIACDNLLKVITLDEIVARIDPAIVAQELDPVLNGLLTQMLHTIANREIPQVWKALPNSAKEEIILKVREDAPPTITELLEDVRQNITGVFDLADMVANALIHDPGLLCHMFIATGNKELIFIRDFGAAMGLIFGIIQVLLWIHWSAGWMLPTFGFVVGMGTNWIALKMIFEPVDPVSLFGGRIVLQGLFLKRQTEASAEFSKIIADNVLAARNLIPAIIKGRCSDKLFELIHQHIAQACDKHAGKAKPVIRLLSGEGKFNKFKNEVGSHLIGHLTDTMRHTEKYLDQSMDLESVLSGRIGGMPASDFEQMLHPVFQQDEWKLVLLGGVLGVFVGMCQWQALGS